MFKVQKDDDKEIKSNQKNIIDPYKHEKTSNAQSIKEETYKMTAE